MNDSLLVRRPAQPSTRRQPTQARRLFAQTCALTRRTIELGDRVFALQFQGDKRGTAALCRAVSHFARLEVPRDESAKLKMYKAPPGAAPEDQAAYEQLYADAASRIQDAAARWEAARPFTFAGTGNYDGYGGLHSMDTPHTSATWTPDDSVPDTAHFFVHLAAFEDAARWCQERVRQSAKPDWQHEVLPGDGLHFPSELTRQVYFFAHYCEQNRVQVWNPEPMHGDGRAFVSEGELQYARHLSRLTARVVTKQNAQL